VEDTGPGISPEEQRNLFRPFTQTKAGREMQTGTGLGLAISRQFARLMNGDLTVSSEAGRGSIFRLDIPVEPAEEGDAREEILRCRVSGLQPGSQAPRILVVDDEPLNRGWLTTLLSLVGFEVKEAENGEDAIRVWQEWSPSLILMDLRMPVLDGYGAAKKILGETSGQRPVIIALTASAMEEDRRRTVGTGFDGFISKPCREDELLETIRTHLKLDYVYEEAERDRKELDHLAGGKPQDEADFRQLPTELIDQLIAAVEAGQKSRLDDLIQKVSEHDTRSSQVLRDLADQYEYDTLSRVLTGARS